jgi:hypothetical protein
MLICAALLVVAAALSATLVRPMPDAAKPVEADQIDLAQCLHCGVTGPQLHPVGGTPA